MVEFEETQSQLENAKGVYGASTTLSCSRRGMLKIFKRTR